MAKLSKTLTAFRLTEAQLEGLRQLKLRDGVGHSEAVRRAIDAWLEEKGIRTSRKGLKALKRVGKGRRER